MCERSFTEGPLFSLAAGTWHLPSLPMYINSGFYKQLHLQSLWCDLRMKYFTGQAARKVSKDFSKGSFILEWSAARANTTPQTQCICLYCTMRSGAVHLVHYFGVIQRNAFSTYFKKMGWKKTNKNKIVLYWIAQEHSTHFLCDSNVNQPLSAFTAYKNILKVQSLGKGEHFDNSLKRDKYYFWWVNLHRF